MNLKDLKVVFAGCARNCSNFLPKVLDNIEFYSSFFSESYMIIVENGSTGKTKEILKSNKLLLEQRTKETLQLVVY